MGGHRQSTPLGWSAGPGVACMHNTHTTRTEAQTPEASCDWTNHSTTRSRRPTARYDRASRMGSHDSASLRD